MRVVQLGLPFSPNLGDGVISDCLVWAVRERFPEAEVATLDLSGRRGRGDVTVRHRSLAIKALGLMPRRLGERVVAARLKRLLDRVEPEWEAAVRGADLAIIGGGQIFSDADLNFCLKIARACEVIARHRVPVAVHAAGVARNWSPRGGALFAEVLRTDLRLVGLRDAYSVEAWRDQMAGRGGPDPVLTRDPGLLAAACYGPGSDADLGAGAAGRIGVCVTDPAILAYHADGASGRRDGLDLVAETAMALCARGHRVMLFCNGAAEDRAALARLPRARPEIAERIARGEVAVALPATPADLARLIAPLAAVVAHRLHACILAYAYRVPVVGLEWDRKVESFFASVGRPDLFVRAAEAAPAGIAARVERALAAGLDEASHARVVVEAREGVDRALDAGLGGARAG